MRLRYNDIAVASFRSIFCENSSRFRTRFSLVVTTDCAISLERPCFFRKSKWKRNVVPRESTEVIICILF